MRSRTRYAKCGDLNLAYQVAGDGAVGIVLVPSFVSNLETGRRALGRAGTPGARGTPRRDPSEGVEAEQRLLDRVAVVRVEPVEVARAL